MRQFETLSAPASLLLHDNVDTDVIFPARFLLIPEKKGLGRYAFHDWRSKSRVAGEWSFAPTRILVAGENFGCGSSREQAVWALADLGVAVIIARSFGEIFQINCFKNGLLPITLAAADHAAVVAASVDGSPLAIDLAAGEIRTRDGTVAFAIPPERRKALLEGLDEIGRVLAARKDAIDHFEARRLAEAPWTDLRGNTFISDGARG
jgi:3-isopropylmalate/(R)-2-methylmalate dehydratase small subunit